MRALAWCAGFTLAAGLGAGAQDGAGAVWPPYNKGVKWQKSLEEAQKLARKEKKLLLYYLNTGDVDKDKSS